MRRPIEPWTTAALAAWYRKKASSTVSGPNESPPASPHSPSAPRPSANTCPARPVATVARLRSPVALQIAACAILPPSSGKAGIRLKTSTSVLIVATQLSHTSAGVARTPLRATATSKKSP